MQRILRYFQINRQTRLLSASPQFWVPYPKSSHLSLDFLMNICERQIFQTTWQITEKMAWSTTKTTQKSLCSTTHRPSVAIDGRFWVITKDARLTAFDGLNIVMLSVSSLMKSTSDPAVTSARRFGEHQFLVACHLASLGGFLWFKRRGTTWMSLAVEIVHGAVERFLDTVAVYWR